MNTAHRVNGVAFELAHFPYQARLEFFDTIAGAWSPCLTAEGHPTVLVQETSRPAVIPTLVQQQSSVHPFHYGPGHWQKFDLRITPVKASRFRLVFTRPFGSGPTDRQGQALAYPLGVRNFHTSFKVRERRDAPHLPPHPVYGTWESPIDSTSDLVGSAVSYSLRENRADDLLRGAIWKSEPQPFSHAVVNFYSDVRDAQSNAQVIDRLYLDPTHSGVTVNAYYSNDIPDGSFVADKTPRGHLGGAANSTLDLHGRVFPDAGSWVDVSNGHVHLDPAQPFWIGIRFAVAYDSTDTNTHPIFDFGQFSLAVTAGTFSLGYGTATADLPLTFGANSTLTLIASWDGASMSLFQPAGTPSTTTIVNPDPTPPAVLRFFGNQVDETLTGAARLVSLVLKQAEPSAADIAAFTTDDATLNTYVFGAENEVGPSTTDNALLRFSLSFVGSDNQIGFVGGPGNRFAGLSWTPLNRDFTAVKGYIDLPPVKAKFLNLEFTNLAPEPFDTFQAMYRTVKVHSFEPLREYIDRIDSTRYERSPGGLKTNADIAGQLTFLYGDFVGRTAPSVPAPAHGYSRTEAFYTRDPATYSGLRGVDPLYGMQTHHRPRTAPRHRRHGVHVYREVSVKHETRIGYFCGLKAFKVYRTEYIADDDTRQYDELFHDDHHIASNNGWVLDDNHLSTPTTLSITAPTTVVSKPFRSRRKVMGLQFATSQTPPSQLLRNADFNLFNQDGTADLSDWKPIGDAVLDSSNRYNTDIGTTVSVQRLVHGTVLFGHAHQAVTTITTVGSTPYDPENFTWGGIEVRYGTYDHAETATYDMLAGIDIGLSTGDTSGSTVSYLPGQIVGQPLLGGIGSMQFATPSQAGRLYAAARVVAPQAPQAPLWVQIISDAIDPISGDNVVLAEEPFNVPAGIVAEWFVGYTVGEGQVGSGQVGVRLVQKYATGDAWYVDNLSLYEDAIIWEFSNDGGDSFYPVFDIRNNPDGVFVFPPTGQANPGAEVGTTLVWRVTGYRPDLHINSLTIRPWYGDLLGAVSPRELTHQMGGNATDYDHYPPIRFDPHWRLWHKPVPVEWWFFYRQWLLLQTEEIVKPLFNKPVFLVDWLVLDMAPASVVVSDDVVYRPPFVLQDLLIL